MRAEEFVERTLGNPDLEPEEADTLGLGVVLVMVGAMRLPARVPAALFAVVAFSLVGVVIGAAGRGVAMVGALPPGLPSIEIPTIESGELARLAATAASIAVVVLAQSAAVARSFAQKNGYRVDTNADLVGLSAANAGSALTGGFAINGSPPRTAAGDSAGSHSQMVNVVMALVIAAVLLFASGLFAYVPEPVLDAVVLGIGIHLVNVRELRRVGQTRRVELWIAVLALVVVAFVGVEQGVLLAVLVSLLERARHQYRPSDEVLVSPGVIGERERARLSGVPPELLARVLAYRFGASLIFANAERFDERIRGLVEQAEQPVRTVVIDAGAMTDIDVTGAEVLSRLATDLAGADIRVVLTDLSPSAARTLQRAGVVPGAIDVVDHLETVVSAARR